MGVVLLLVAWSWFGAPTITTARFVDARACSDAGDQFQKVWPRSTWACMPEEG